MSALVLAVLLCVLVLVLLDKTHTSTADTKHHLTRPITHASAADSVRSQAKYGGLPSWLPKPKVHVGRTLHASSTHQVLAIQGETVAVDLSGTSLLATAAGPSVPEEGRVPVPETSPCTFTVTFAHASKSISIHMTDFTFVDEEGHVRHPRVTAMDGGPMPALVQPGKTTSLLVKDVLPTGDGGLLWKPTAGRPIVAWDFDVEID